MNQVRAQTCGVCIMGLLARCPHASFAWSSGGSPTPRRSLLQDHLLPMIGTGAATCISPALAAATEGAASPAAASPVPSIPAAADAGGVLWRTASQHAVPATPSALAKIMREEVLGPVSSLAECSSGMVCISERHDDFEHHKIQLKVLMTMKKVLSERSQNVNEKLSIGMEMFQQRHQRHLDRYITTTDDTYKLADLMHDTEWDSTWGYDILHYLPTLLFARNHGIRILGLHPSDAEVELVQRFGLDKAHVMSGICLDDREHAREFGRAVAHQLTPAELRDGAAAALARRYEVQCFREEYMAATAAAHAADGRWLALLAGERHVLGRRGLPFRALRRAGTGTAVRGRGVFTIVPRTAPFPVAVADAPGTQEADYMWYVQRDPSVDFREDEVNRAPVQRLENREA